MRLAFYGSSLLSSYWNGAATYYRGLLKELAARGWRIVFFEPDAFDRGAHRDIAPPLWAEVRVFAPTPEGVRSACAAAAGADVVIKASGVGVADDDLLIGAFANAKPGAARVYWDVDAPATLAALRAAGDAHPLRRALPATDLVLCYGGGPTIAAGFEAGRARRCAFVHNGLDPEAHRPAAPDPAFASDLSLLANRLPDRETRIAEFFLRPAALRPQRRFVLGGAGWDDARLPANVRALGHVPTGRHNAFNASARAVLNVARDGMAAAGHAPATRVFEAAGAGACLITDAWPGIEAFFAPGAEILVARDGQDVAEALDGLTPMRALMIGAAARERALRHHTYARRAAVADRLLRAALQARRREAVA